MVLLQHPREARMPIGTARMAHLSLPNSELHEGVSFRDDARINTLLDEPGTALLFPGDGSVDPHDVAPGQVRHLIVIDGTWSQARKVLKQNPMLLRLPRIGLNTGVPSSYRIRKEPSLECLATVEAIASVLGVLEGRPAEFDAMLAAFVFMVDAQIAHASARVSPTRWKRPRVRAPSDEQRIVAALPHVVLVYGEVNAHSRRSNVPGVPELLHLVARRASGEVFDAVLAPRRPLAKSTAFHLELSAEEILAGESAAAVRRRWHEFVRPVDLFVSWGAYTNHLMATERLPLDVHIDLRPVVARRLQSRPGSPADALAALGGVVAPGVARGRAGRFVAALEQVVAALVARPCKRFREDATVAQRQEGNEGLEIAA